MMENDTSRVTGTGIAADGTTTITGIGIETGMVTATEIETETTTTAVSAAIAVDTGVAWGFSNGGAIGMRIAFDVNSSQFGFVPRVLF